MKYEEIQKTNWKGSSTKGSEPQRIRERRGGKSCLIWVSYYAKARIIQTFFPQSSFDISLSLKFKSRFSKTMTFAFIALKPSRRFVARITFQSVRILQVISCPIFWNFSYSRGVKGKEVILSIIFCLESFQMIANGVSKFISFSLQ